MSAQNRHVFRAVQLLQHSVIAAEFMAMTVHRHDRNGVAIDARHARNIAVEQSALAIIVGPADAVALEEADGLLLKDGDNNVRQIGRQLCVQPDLNPFLRLANTRSPSRKASSIAGTNSVMGSSLP